MVRKKERLEYDILNDTKNNYVEYLFLELYGHNRTLLAALSEVCHKQLSGMTVIIITKVPVLWSMCLRVRQLR